MTQTEFVKAFVPAYLAAWCVKNIDGPENHGKHIVTPLADVIGNAMQNASNIWFECRRHNPGYFSSVPSDPEEE